VLSIVFGVGGKLLGTSAAAQLITAGVAVICGPDAFLEQAIASAVNKIATVIVVFCMAGLQVSKLRADSDVARLLSSG
jgi:hypothetical protein